MTHPAPPASLEVRLEQATVIEKSTPNDPESGYYYVESPNAALLREAKAELTRLRSEVERHAALRDAMWQLLDDMGTKGTAVCLAAKAQARIAFEPFRDDDSPLDWPLEEAQRIWKEATSG